MTKTSIIILAAGRGTRMKSQKPKVLHKVAGLEMLNMVIDSAESLNPQEIAIVVSEEFDDYKQQIIDQNPDLQLKFALQKDRRGTADAAGYGFNALTKDADKIVILYGDTPLLKGETLQKLSDLIVDDVKIGVLGFECNERNQYGKFLIANDGSLERIIEHKDANEAEKQIKICNSGVVVAAGDKFSEFLMQIDNRNAAGEFYLTDLVKVARQNDFRCGYLVTNGDEVLGVNSRAELAKVEAIKQDELRNYHMAQGVALTDPKTVHFAYDTLIGNDVVIHPNVVFGEAVEVASNVEIKSFSHIEGANIDSGVVIGPFARIRPGVNIAQDAKIGNFVEVKNSNIKQGAKVNHLSYIGDSDVGQGANIGAGVITCIYDGYNKYRSEIGDNVFVGSNSALVAPVKVAKGAIVAAGSVVVEDVQENDLVIARSDQVNIKDGAEKFRNKRK